jgi:predicted metal-dependent phosphoesterase TrpH
MSEEHVSERLVSEAGWVRADFHSHTSHSRDGLTSPRELVERAAAAGLDRIAVTDHGEIDGALEARALDPGRVIVGEEVTTRSGIDVLGLFLTERIPQHLALQEVVERIRAQGGVIVAPHPCSYPLHGSAKAAAVLAVADAVEVDNARGRFVPAWNARAERAAAARGLPTVAGSDAHLPLEIGRAATLLPAFADAASLRAALRAARVVRGDRADHGRMGDLLVSAASVAVGLALTAARWGRRPPARPPGRG